jgi:hypothetical protein
MAKLALSGMTVGYLLDRYVAMLHTCSEQFPGLIGKERLRMH